MIDAALSEAEDALEVYREPDGRRPASQLETVGVERAILLLAQEVSILNSVIREGHIPIYGKVEVLGI